MFPVSDDPHKDRTCEVWSNGSLEEWDLRMGGDAPLDMSGMEYGILYVS